MGFIEIPEVQKLQGEEAIQALQSLIAGLEHNSDSKLTNEQKKTLIKIASSLITSIREEKQGKKDRKAVQTFSEQDQFAFFRRIFPWISR